MPSVRIMVVGQDTLTGAQVTASLVSFCGGGYPVEKFEIPKWSDMHNFCEW